MCIYRSKVAIENCSRNYLCLIAHRNSLEGTDVLIGMDIITAGDLAITNHNGRTTFSFRVPSCEEIDFVGEINEHNRHFSGDRTARTPDDQRKLRNKQKAMKKKNR